MDAVEGKTSLFASSLAAETKREADSFAGLPKRLARYANGRDYVLAIKNYISRLRPQTIEMAQVCAELDACAVWLTFHHYTERQVVRLARVHSCYKHLLCPFCAIRRGARLIVAYMARLNVIRSYYQYRGDRALLASTFVMTVKDGEDLGERTGHLFGSWQALNKNRRRDRREVAKFVGAFWSFEAKRGENSGLWHPHFHGLALSAEPIDENKFRDDWYDVTGDSHVAQVRPMYGEPGEAFAEIFKYALKFQTLPHADLWDAYRTLRGKKLIGSSGVFRGVEVPEYNADELFEGEEYRELFYRYFRGAGYVAQASPTRGVPPAGWVAPVVSDRWRAVIAALPAVELERYVG